MLRGTRGIELALGALAVISGAVIMGSIWLGGLIAPESVFPDVIGYGLMLLVVALGVTLDVLAPTGATKAVALILLTLGTMALLGWFAISFIVSFGAPAILALIVTALAYIRLSERPIAPAAG